MAVIEARGLRKAYGITVAVDGVDLQVEKGRILGLIGPTAPARPPRSMRFWASRHTRES